MIIDSSALIAIVLQEPGHDELLDAVESTDVVGIGAPTLVETSVVMATRAGPAGITVVQRFVADAEVAVISFQDSHRRVAVGAYLRFGKGRHPARLNLGDCYSYATAQVAGRPLLCVGDDFAQTDLDLVPLPTP